jgi:hypothetical protein
MIGRTYLERGSPVVVLAKWAGKGPRNVLIERQSGELVVRPFRGLRTSQPGVTGTGPAKDTTP